MSTTQGPSPSAAALGLNLLHCACLEGDLERVMELLAAAPSSSSTIDAPVLSAFYQPPDETAWPSGETPLMLAALMGHLRVFEYLVRQGADYAFRDGDDFPVQFYASELPFADDKRALYLKYGVGREPVRAIHARSAVADLLDHPSRLHMMISGGGDSGYPGIFIGKEGAKIKLFACIDKFDTGKALGPEKTIGGVKVRDNHQVLKVAISGFKGQNPDSRVLDQGIWNIIALTTVAEAIKFKFHGNLHDNGARRPLPHHLGRVQAGHVEVQLATYYVVEMAEKNAGRVPGGEAWTMKQKLRALRTAYLGPERYAVIFINSQPCTACHKYIQALSDCTGISFFLKGDAGIGPTRRAKIGRGRMAVDLVGDTFSGPDDDEAGPSTIGMQPENQPVVAPSFPFGDTIPDADIDSDGTMVLTPTPSPPLSYTNITFAPPPSGRPAEIPPSFRDRIQSFRYAPTNTERPHPPRRQRTQEERLRYRNPFPAPIFEAPNYMLPTPRPQGDDTHLLDREPDARMQQQRAAPSHPRRNHRDHRTVNSGGPPIFFYPSPVRQPRNNAHHQKDHGGLSALISYFDDLESD